MPSQSISLSYSLFVIDDLALRDKQYRRLALLPNSVYYNTYYHSLLCWSVSTCHLPGEQSSRHPVFLNKPLLLNVEQHPRHPMMTTTMKNMIQPFTLLKVCKLVVASLAWLAYKNEGFGNAFWRNVVLISLAGVAAVKFAPAANDEVYLTRWIAMYSSPRDYWLELNAKHTAQQAKVSEDHLLVSDAHRPAVHRFRYPQ